MNLPDDITNSLKSLRKYIRGLHVDSLEEKVKGMKKNELSVLKKSIEVMDKNNTWIIISAAAALSFLCTKGKEIQTWLPKNEYMIPFLVLIVLFGTGLKFLITLYNAYFSRNKSHINQVTNKSLTYLSVIKERKSSLTSIASEIQSLVDCIRGQHYKTRNDHMAIDTNVFFKIMKAEFDGLVDESNKIIEFLGKDVDQLEKFIDDLSDCDTVLRVSKLMYSVSTAFFCIQVLFLGVAFARMAYFQWSLGALKFW